MLLQQGLPGKPHAGEWEFPGGKVENEENPRVALCREITEELGLTLDSSVMAPVGFSDESGEGPRPAIVLILYACPVWSGKPEACEGQGWGWFTPAEAAALQMPAMDRALLQAVVG